MQSPPVNMAEKRSDFHRDVLVTGFLEIAGMFLRFLISVILARGLGPEGRGVYALALAAPGLLLNFSNVGIGEATTVLLGKRKYPAHRVLGSMNLLIVAMALLGAGVYFGFSHVFLKILRNNVPFEIYAMSFLVFPLTLFWGGSASAALGFSMARKVAWGRMFNNALFLLLAAAAYSRGMGVRTVIWIFIASLIAENAYLFFFIRRESPFGLCYAPEVIREQLAIGRHFFAGGLFLQVTKRLDIFLVNYFLGPTPLGLYTVAFSVAEFVLTVPAVYARAAFSSVAVSSGTESFSVSNSAIRQSILLMVLLGGLLVIGMRPLITGVYSAKFAAAVVPALVLIPGVILLGFSSLMGYIFTAHSRPQEITKAAAISCGFTVALDFLLIPRYGILGAAAASSAAYAAGAVWLITSYVRFSGESLSDIIVVKKSDLEVYRVKLREIFKD